MQPWCVVLVLSCGRGSHGVQCIVAGCASSSPTTHPFILRPPINRTVYLVYQHKNFRRKAVCWGCSLLGKDTPPPSPQVTSVLECNLCGLSKKQLASIRDISWSIGQPSGVIAALSPATVGGVHCSCRAAL